MRFVASFRMPQHKVGGSKTNNPEGISPSGLENIRIEKQWEGGAERSSVLPSKVVVFWTAMHPPDSLQMVIVRNDLYGMKRRKRGCPIRPGLFLVAGFALFKDTILIFIRPATQLPFGFLMKARGLAGGVKRIPDTCTTVV